MSRTVVLTDSRYLDQRMPSALAEELRRSSSEVTLLCADRLVTEVARGPLGLDGLGPGDVVVPRTRHPLGLTILSAAELTGAHCFNNWTVVQGVRDKARAALVLAQAGVAMPPTYLAESPIALSCLTSEAWPLLLKPTYGDNATGIVFVRDAEELADVRWSDGLVLAQRYVDVAGVDIKLYGAGDHVWAVRRSSPLLDSSAFVSAVTLPVTAELRSLAYACRDAFGLDFYGVDVLPSPTGPLVVDVNDFPNYTGVPEAPGVLAEVIRCAS